jgi:hypothetical protein
MIFINLNRSNYYFSSYENQIHNLNLQINCLNFHFIQIFLHYTC